MAFRRGGGRRERGEQEACRGALDEDSHSPASALSRG